MPKLATFTLIDSKRGSSLYCTLYGGGAYLVAVLEKDADGYFFASKWYGISSPKKQKSLHTLADNIANEYSSKRGYIVKSTPKSELFDGY